MVVTAHSIRILSASVLLLALGACSRVDNLSDLQAYATEVKGRPGAPVDPVPVFEPYEGFIYSAASLRSPFDVPVVIDGESGILLSQDVEPDFEREREPLENHALSGLTMVGMLVRNDVYQALIEDAMGVVHRVAVGNYMGRNFGRIESITETQLNLREIVPSGNGGWVERPQTLTLQ